MELAGKKKVMGRDVTVKEVMDEVVKDSVYYRVSGGGITLSGGECLYQPEFAEGLLRAAHDYGFTTAIESTACAPSEVIRRILPHLDYYLMDIKHIDSNKHKEFTGRDNTLILENAKIIAQEGKKLIVRVPVIPTFNDTVDEISAIAAFTAEINPGGEINLLPYHKFGSDKYKGLGRDYIMSHISPPTQEKMEQLKAAAERFGLKVSIGG